MRARHIKKNVCVVRIMIREWEMGRKIMFENEIK